MKLNQNVFQRLLDSAADMADECYGQENLERVGFPVFHAQGDSFKDDILVRRSGEQIDRTKDEDNAYIILEIGYDDIAHRGRHIVADFNSTILRNMSNHISAFADVVEKLESDTNQVPINKSRGPIGTPRYIDIRDIIEENKAIEFHMKLNIEDSNIEEKQYTKVGL